MPRNEDPHSDHQQAAGRTGRLGIKQAGGSSARFNGGKPSAEDTGHPAGHKKDDEHREQVGDFLHRALGQAGSGVDEQILHLLRPWPRVGEAVQGKRRGHVAGGEHEAKR
jgi:hypothetical protein